MRIIDAHVHTLECGTMCNGEVNVEFKKVRNGLKKHGIDKAILMPINDISYQPVKQMNDYMVEIVNNTKNFVGFIDIDISKTHLAGGIKELEEEITYYYNKGLKGIKIHLQNLGVKADDWRLLSVYRLAGELNIPITIHCYPGSPPGLIDNSDPVNIEKMVRSFHNIDFIIAHFGGVKYFYDMPRLNHENVYFETSGVMPVLKKYLPQENIYNIFEEIGFDNIIFGSDYPTADINETIAILKEIVPKDQLEKVMYKNILKLGNNYNWWEDK